MCVCVCVCERETSTHLSASVCACVCVSLQHIGVCVCVCVCVCGLWNKNWKIRPRRRRASLCQDLSGKHRNNIRRREAGFHWFTSSALNDHTEAQSRQNKSLVELGETCQYSTVRLRVILTIDVSPML